MIKFSILTSLYNSKEFLDNYFNTIFSQEVLPTEIILIDDTNNPDNLNEIINKKKFLYNFENIKILKNNINLGPATSLNKGIKLCSNDLIFRLDVDDTWSPDHTKKMITYYLENNDFLIYAVSLKKKNFLTNLKCDNFLINENHLIHSSWLINRTICKKFRYHMLTPIVALEDYFSLLYYINKNFKIFFTHYQTVKYNFVENSHGRNFSKNIKYRRIRKLISKKMLYVNLNNKKYILEKIKFFIFDYGLLKYLILQFWIFDKIYLRKYFK